MMIRRFLRQYFTFNRRERNGILVLLVLIGVLLTGLVIAELAVTETAYDFSGFNRMAAGLRMREPVRASVRKDSAEKESRVPLVAEAAGEHSIYRKQELFYFNPNGLPVEDWMRLGLSRAQAESVKNFEAKGGRFRKKEDLRRLYVISPEFYLRVEDHIVIPPADNVSASAVPVGVPALARPAPGIVELNAADTAELMSLPGIGAVFARRIISYRNRLGGFERIEQLLEVFGFDADRFEQIRMLVKADPEYLSRININTIGADELKRHPYFTPSVAQAIVSFRKAHGAFQRLDDLRRIDLVNEDLYRKIAPYLTL